MEVSFPSSSEEGKVKLVYTVEQLSQTLYCRWLASFIDGSFGGIMV